jgi:PAS domain-containing protein
MDCFFCHASAASSDRFCSRCGARLAAGEVGADSPAVADVLFDHRSFEKMVAVFPNMICVLDVVEPRYSYVNDAIVRFLGYPCEQLMTARDWSSAVCIPKICTARLPDTTNS